MAESFGTRLRQRREEQNIAVAKIAEKTKIKQSLLEALERDDISHWPAGIFRRAFIRDYALVVGLDPDVVAREFSEAFPEPVEVVTTAGLSAAADTARGTTGTTRFGSLLRRNAPPEESREEVALPAPPDPPLLDLPKTVVEDEARTVVECVEPD